MDTEELLFRLAIRLQQPAPEAWWTTGDVAEYLGVNKKRISVIVNHHSFPKPIRLPSPKGNGQRRWKDTEVIRWVDSL